MAAMDFRSTPQRDHGASRIRASVQRQSPSLRNSAIAAAGLRSFALLMK
jgi:hypothetical protein